MGSPQNTRGLPGPITTDTGRVGHSAHLDAVFGDRLRTARIFFTGGRANIALRRFPGHLSKHRQWGPRFTLYTSPFAFIAHLSLRISQSALALHTQQLALAFNRL